jgi:multiple sugar transport system ATP-binding protein
VHPKQGAPVSDVQGRVELIEALGADTLIHVDVGGVPLIARQNDRTPLQAGDDVAVELDPSRAASLQPRRPFGLRLIFLLFFRTFP